MTTNSNDNKAYFKQTDNAINLLLCYGVEVRIRKSIRCISPNHDDKRPSASFFSKDGELRYKCFSCGFGGDVFSVIAELTGKSEKEIIKELCKSDDKYKTHCFSHILPTNKPRKEKESRKVYLTNDKAEFDRLFSQSEIIVRNNYCYYDFKSETNNLVEYLFSLFKPETVRTALDLYKVRTSGERDVLFTYADRLHRICRFKVMEYNSDGHRVHHKEEGSSRPDADIYESNSTNILPDGSFMRCKEMENTQKAVAVYGEHLVKDSTKCVYLVESEKSAIMYKAFLIEGGVTDVEVLAIGGSGAICELVSRLANVPNVVYYPDLKKGITTNMLRSGNDCDIVDQYEKISGAISQYPNARITTRLCRATADFVSDSMLEKTGFDVGDALDIVIRKGRADASTTLQSGAKCDNVPQFVPDVNIYGEIVESHFLVPQRALNSFKALSGHVPILTKHNEPYKKEYHTAFMLIVCNGYILEWSFVYSDLWNIQETRERALKRLRAWYSELAIYFDSVRRGTPLNL